MQNIRKLSSTLKKLQLKIDRAKFFKRTLHSSSVLEALKISNKTQKYASQLDEEVNFQQQQQQQQQRKLSQNSNNNTVEQQLLALNHSLNNKMIKAISKISYINFIASQQVSNQFIIQQHHRQQRQHHHIIKASLATTAAATAITFNNLFICQNQQNNSINKGKLSRISDSDFFIFKAESCANLLSNFIIQFINNITSLEKYFYFNLNILLNGNHNIININKNSNDLEYLYEKNKSIILLAENNNNNNNNINKIYSANIFGANFISKCIKFNKNIVNILKNSDTNNNLNSKMSKVATEQPPINISNGNIQNDSAKELSGCSSSSTLITGNEILLSSAVASASSSPSASSLPAMSSTGNGSITTNQLEKSEKESCFTSSLGDIIKFLELVGGLKHTKRTGFVLRDVKNCESISGHMYRMAMMTFLLDGTEGLNQTKCMELALVHDLAECIVGDLTPFCGVTKEEKKRMEMDAMEKICKLIEPRGRRMWELFVEYECGESAESKFVKDLDRLDMVLQAFEYEKRDDCLMKHQEFFDSTEGKFEHSFVQKLVKEIYDQRDKLANERGCTSNMYPKPSFLQQNGNNHSEHDEGDNQNNQNNEIVVNGDEKLSKSETATTKTTPSLSSSSSSNGSASASASSSVSDLDQKKASNGR